MADYDSDDLANLLSEEDVEMFPSQSCDTSITKDEISELDFVDYDSDKMVSDSSDYDPFNVNDLSSDDDNSNNTSCSGSELSHKEEMNDDANVTDANSAMDPQIDLSALHRWPQPHTDAFASRVINIEKLPVSMHEKQVFETLFHDIPSVHHPTNIRLFHNRHHLSDKNNSKYGFGQIIFDDADTVEAIMPLLKQKQLNYNNKFRLFRKASLFDIVTDHSVHHRLKDNTLRLVFINLHWKCKALNIYQFIKSCLAKYKQNNPDLTVKVHNMLPIKIQMIEDDHGYSTGCAFVDFENAKTASTVLFACHENTLMDHTIYVDWHPFHKRVKSWWQQQKVHRAKKNTQRLLIHNLHAKITENDIRMFVEKHLVKVQNNNSEDVILKDVHLIHNRNNPLLCGYALLYFVDNEHDEYNTAHVFGVMQKLLHRIQYKVLQHRSIFAMFVQNKSHQTDKQTQLKDKTRFVMMDNLVWDINEVNVEQFVNQINVKDTREDEDLYHSINIIVDANGYPIGKTLIKCVSPEIATQLVSELDGKLCRERAVVMEWCDDKQFQSIQSKHNQSFLNIMEFSSHFNVTQMTYLHDQLFGDHDFVNGELRHRKRAKKRNIGDMNNEKKRYRKTKKDNKNADIVSKYNQDVESKRKARKKIFQQAKITMIDERMLKEMKRGKTLQDARPKTKGEIRAMERKGKVGMWTKLGMSKAEMLRMKKKIDWNTGKSVLSKVIAKNRTIHVKDYWKDSLKHARRRNRNRLYIQKTSKHAKHRKGGFGSKRKK